MVEQSVSYAAERRNQRCNQYGKIHFNDNIFHILNKKILMVIIGMWLGG
jgi:hypothetical protein